jgi:AraC family transcriptional regulator
LHPRIELNAQGRRRPFLRAPDFASAEHPWAGCPFEETYSRNEPIARAAFAKTTIFLCTADGGVAHRKHRGTWEHHKIEPGHVFVARRDVEIEAAWTTKSWPTMCLQIDGATLRSLAGDQIETMEKSLVPAITTPDQRLAGLMLAMREEVRAGCPSGRLYGESISLALLAYLTSRYTDLGPEKTHRGCFTAAEARNIVAYIDANLTRNICVTDLAGLLQISPSHFARVFKISFGLAPYHFVMHKRVEAAKGMLERSKFSSSHIALSLGFASQSHFVKVFRQFTGVTPRQYRAGF